MFRRPGGGGAVGFAGDLTGTDISQTVVGIRGGVSIDTSAIAAVSGDRVTTHSGTVYVLRGKSRFGETVAEAVAEAGPFEMARG